MLDIYLYAELKKKKSEVFDVVECEDSVCCCCCCCWSEAAALCGFLRSAVEVSLHPVEASHFSQSDILKPEALPGERGSRCLCTLAPFLSSFIFVLTCLILNESNVFFTQEVVCVF